MFDVLIREFRLHVLGRFDAPRFSAEKPRAVLTPRAPKQRSSANLLHETVFLIIGVLTNVLGRFDAPRVSGQKPRAVLTPRGPQKSDLNSSPREFLSKVVFLRKS